MAPRILGYALAAFSSVSLHKEAFIFVSIAKPITLESKQSKMAETYSFPSQPLISVISVTHFVSGSSAWKSRFNRSSDFLASLSAFVIPFGIRPVYCCVQMVIFRVICGEKFGFSVVFVWFLKILLSWCYHDNLFLILSP